MTELTDSERSRLRQALFWVIRDASGTTRCCDGCATPHCHTGVIRRGDYEPCGKPPVAIGCGGDDVGSRHFWPVCAHHARAGLCAPLHEVLAEALQIGGAP